MTRDYHPVTAAMRDAVKTLLVAGWKYGDIAAALNLPRGTLGKMALDMVHNGEIEPRVLGRPRLAALVPEPNDLVLKRARIALEDGDNGRKVG